MSQQSLYQTDAPNSGPMPRGLGSVTVGKPMDTVRMANMRANSRDSTTVMFPYVQDTDNIVIGGIVAHVRDPDSGKFTVKNNGRPILGSLGGLRVGTRQANFLKALKDDPVALNAWRLAFARENVEYGGIATHSYNKSIDSADQGLTVQLSGVFSTFKGMTHVLEGVNLVPGDRVYADVPVENRGQFNERLATFARHQRTVGPSGQLATSFNMEPVGSREYHASCVNGLRNRIEMMTRVTSDPASATASAFFELGSSNVSREALDPAASMCNAMLSFVYAALSDSVINKHATEAAVLIGGFNFVTLVHSDDTRETVEKDGKTLSDLGITHETTTLADANRIALLQHHSRIIHRLMGFGEDSDKNEVQNAFTKMCSAFEAFRVQQDNNLIGIVTSVAANNRVHIVGKNN